MASVLGKLSHIVSKQSARHFANFSGVLVKKIGQNPVILQQRKRLVHSWQKGFLSTISVPQIRQPEFKEVTNGLEISIPSIENGKPFFVDYMWLYDNCRCPKCFIAYTNQKEVDPRNVTDNIKPQKVEINKTELEITWSSGHEHNYNLNWILENIHEGFPKVDKIKRKEWNSSLKPSQFPTVTYNPSLDRDTTARQMLSGVFEYGFCLVENAPKTFEETKALYESIMPLQRGYWEDEGLGGLFFIQLQDQYFDTAYTNGMLPPHNDGTYLHETPGLIALNCLLQSDVGGDSFFSDAIYVANLLKRKNPEAYECLTTTPIESNYINKGRHYKHCETILRLDPYTKELRQIRYNTSDICPVQTIPQREIRPWFRAMAALTHELYNPENQIKFRLSQGKMYIIDNWTLVHGRMSFSGQRRLAGCFMGHKDFYSRGRILGLI